MKTSQKEYNELLYVINDPNYNTMVPVPISSDGYPEIKEHGTYFYGDEYTPFHGTLDELKTQWPNVLDLPIFYKQQLK